MRPLPADTQHVLLLHLAVKRVVGTQEAKEKNMDPEAADISRETKRISSVVAKG